MLGIAAGLNYARLRSGAGESTHADASSNGFASKADFDALSGMMDHGLIHSLRSDQMALLEKYASVKGAPHSFVSGVLCNVADESLARRTEPIAMTIHRAFADDPEVDALPDVWRKNGCPSAATELKEKLHDAP